MRSHHHLKPKSRGGRNSSDNLVLLPHKWHQSWHALFDTLTPEEACVFIQGIMRPNLKWNTEALLRFRESCKKGK